jgi:hypothetical protein
MQACYCNLQWAASISNVHIVTLQCLFFVYHVEKKFWLKKDEFVLLKYQIENM